MTCFHSPSRPAGRRALVHRFLRLAPMSLCLGSLFAVPAAAQRIHLPPVTRKTWPNGARLALMAYRRAPMLTVLALFPGGTTSDPAGRAGTATLMADVLTRGTETRSPRQIPEEIEFLGGGLDSRAGEDYFFVNLRVLAKDMDTGLDLLADVLRHPTFPAEEIERQRQIMQAGLQSLADDPGAVATRVANETIFAGSPYGVRPTLSTLRAITREDVLACYRRFLTPGRMILVAVGDFAPAALEAKLRAHFGDWTSPQAPPAPESSAGSGPVAAPANAGGPRIVLVDKPDATQTQARFGRRAFPRLSPDYMPAQVADAILGGGFTSRLTQAIRVDRSLTYGIGSGFVPRKRDGSFQVSTFTRIETTRALIDATRAELRRAATKGFTGAELRGMKGYLAGMFAISMQTPEALAGQLADIAFFGLPPDYLETYLPRLRAVTLAQVNRIARTYFAPEGLALVLVAPAARVAGQLRGLGKVETRPVSSVGR